MILIIYLFLIQTEELPENLFSESVGGKPPPKDDGKKRKRGRPLTDSERKMQESFEARNKTVEFVLLCETSANLDQTLRQLNSNKRTLFKEFTDHCDGDKKVAKARLRLIRAKRQAVNNTEVDFDSSDDDDEYNDSQESALLEICDIEESIRNTKADLKKVLDKKESTSKNL